MRSVRLFSIPWIAGHQAPLSMGFSRQEYWGGVPSPSPYKVPRTIKFIEKKVEECLSRTGKYGDGGRGRGNGELLMGIEFSV